MHKNKREARTQKAKTSVVAAVIFLLFGLMGRMDYEDALAFEAAQYDTETASTDE